MKSGGFIGKKNQARNEEPKRAAPTGTDLTQLLATAQKGPGKLLSWVWAASDGYQYTLSVIVTGGAGGGERKGWKSDAIDNGAIGAGEWKLSKELDNKRTELFGMQTSDAFLIQNLLEETFAAASSSAAPSGSGQSSPAHSSSPAPAQGSVLEMRGHEPVTRNVPPPLQPVSAGGGAAAPYLEGNLRQVDIKTIMQAYNTNKSTGRFICDIGTVQSEVFFTDGEPVHAKSCHSIYNDRDTVGDTAVIDLLTWKEGSFKFQQGWPAASRTVTMSLQSFLSGETSPGSSASAPISSSGDPDDFSIVDDLIGATFKLLVDESGLIKYGMFMMLVRSEFVRFDQGRTPFCFAAIQIESPSGTLSNEVLGKIGECFEPACQPLDTISYAGQSRLYALFPQTTCAGAESAIKYFINNVSTTQLDSALHGNALKFSVGVAEVPRDGAEFEQVVAHACKLRKQATPERKVVSSGV